MCAFCAVRLDNDISDKEYGCLIRKQLLQAGISTAGLIAFSTWTLNWQGFEVWLKSHAEFSSIKGRLNIVQVTYNVPKATSDFIVVDVCSA